MRAVVQRVSEAEVTVAGDAVGRIGAGLLVLVGVQDGDAADDAEWLVRKIVGLRVFEDEAGKMNRSVVDTGGSCLLVSQFTLLGDVRKGNRPSFNQAMAPEIAREMFLDVVERVRAHVPVETGRFQEMMKVRLVNEGPVTILMDSRDRSR